MQGRWRLLSAAAIAVCVGLASTGCSSNSKYGGGGGSDGLGSLTVAHTVFIMPKVIGKSLATAQLDIRTAARNQLLDIHSEDATGKARAQTVPRDWKVCTQNVAAGKSLDQTTYILMSVVKLAETCPKS
jgi:hypothetical protein